MSGATSMATERQFAANGLNATRSTGPRTDEGKARSRGNALKHGMAGEGAVVPSGMLDAFDARREAWARDHRPSGEGGEWALDRAVAATFRIEACERGLDGLIVAQAERAKIAWELDRRVDAATIAAGLARDPLLVARRLEASRHGCELMIEFWDRLGEAALANGDWSDAQRSLALDLMGVPAGLRDGRLPTDAPDGEDPAGFLRGLAADEVARLEGFKEAGLDALDALDRRRAESGGSGLLSKPAGLVLRYERDAWRSYRAALADIKNPAVAAVAPEAPAAPRPAATTPQSLGPAPRDAEPPRRPTWPAPSDAPTAASSPLDGFCVGSTASKR